MNPWSFKTLTKCGGPVQRVWWAANVFYKLKKHIL